MPTYEFYCKSCGRKFTREMHLSDYEKKDYICPSCRGRDIKQQVSHFQTRTSKKS